MRLEKDGLGTMNVPDEAYYGIVTLRSMLAYDIGPRTLSDYFPYIRAVTLSKIASAKANMQIGMLSKEYGEAILKASQEILDGKFTDQFPVNIYRGPGTPINMNVNEVIAHRANEILTGNKEGPIKPNNHVNMSQSTGDVQPTAKLILIYELISSLEDPIRSLLRELQHKSEENKKTIQIEVPSPCLCDSLRPFRMLE
jgi:aspartate ammonia-lyase